MPDIAFPLFLISALVLGIALSTWQGRAYGREVREMIRLNAGRKLHLGSGRGKGRLRGAVVLLLIDIEEGAVVEARTMTGMSVFSRFKRAPHLEGSLSGVAGRAGDKLLRQAVEQALDMIPKDAALAQRPTTPHNDSGPRRIVRRRALSN
ncbi:MAG: transcriptional regulator GutM [Propionibacteriaceae bacterium]|nr:transcriptional regulator GutM [Propionibacteriaceae bacterium]